MRHAKRTVTSDSGKRYLPIGLTIVQPITLDLESVRTAVVTVLRAPSVMAVVFQMTVAIHLVESRRSPI